MVLTDHKLAPWRRGATVEDRDGHARHERPDHHAPDGGVGHRRNGALGWLKQVGDRVEADEPLVEVSTDKVDAEIPAPAAGTLVKIVAEADETVEVGSVLGEIEPDGGNGAAAPAEPDAPSEIVDVAFPEMGDSVAEGTVLEWRVKVGDTVSVDDPLVEISTDKVDAEVPSPVAGTITELLVDADETVPVGSVLCRIAAGAGAPTNGPVQPSAEPKEVKRDAPPRRMAGTRLRSPRASQPLMDSM